jgi:hypothetical protein
MPAKGQQPVPRALAQIRIDVAQEELKPGRLLTFSSTRSFTFFHTEFYLLMIAAFLVAALAGR